MEEDTVGAAEHNLLTSTIVADNGITNFSKPEQTMINRLVGNDQDARDFVLSKLEEWFKALCDRYPAETQDESPLVTEMKDNFARIWTTLLYSIFRISDDNGPIALSETIIEYLTVLGPNQNTLTLFMDRFFVVLIREWGWIHPLMGTRSGAVIIRLFIIKFLQTLTAYEWREEYVDPFLRILEMHLFNLHPPPPRSTRSTSRTPIPLQAPIDLQIHFIRVIIEELGNISKVNSKMLKLLSCFVVQLIQNKNPDVVNEINRCIQEYILNKSENCSIEHLGTSLNEIELSDKIPEMTQTTLLAVMATATDDPLKSDSVTSCDIGAKDSKLTFQPPRLNFDYGGIVHQLKDANKKIGNKVNHEATQDLLKQIQAIMVDRPVPDTVNPETHVQHDEVKTPLTSSLPVDSGRKRKNKVRQKLLLKKVTPSPVEPITNWNSKYLNDPELLDHICDNYMSYLVEMERSSTFLASSTAPESADSQPSSDNDHDHVKRRKLIFEANPVDMNPVGEGICANVETGSSVDVTNLYISVANVMTRKRKHEDCKKSESSDRPGTSDSVSTLDDDDVTPKRRKIFRNYVQSNVAYPGSSHRKVPPSTAAASTKTTDSGFPSSTPIVLTPTPFPKGVRFVLASNLEHELKDYQTSIEESPVVPYDGNQCPSSGLLKTTKSPVHWKKRAAATAIAGNNASKFSS